MTENLRPTPAWARIAAGVTRRLPRGRSRVIEWLCRGSNGRFLARMPQELGAYEFDCSLRDMISRQVFFAGCYFAQEVSFLRGVLQRGMSFVDVGANWGLFTLLASHLVGSSGRVLALEPDPRMVARLRFNVQHNGLDKVEIVEMAAADRDSEFVLSGHDPEVENWAASRLVQNQPEHQPSFHVQGRRLDDLLDQAGLERASLVKIDVEGAEDMVLSGMEAGLGRHRYERLLLELHPTLLAERHRTVQELMALLAGKGYRGYALDSSPAASRTAYYRPWQHFTRFLAPLKQAMEDSHPHTVWLSPEIAPFSQLNTLNQGRAGGLATL